jgi:hypothetical protein
VMESCLQAPKSVRFGLFEANFAAGELRKHVVGTMFFS